MFNELKNKITSKTAKIVVVGMGYVGTAVTEALLDSNLDVVCYDIDTKTIKELQSISSFKKIVTLDINEIKNRDIYIICLPTPLKEYVHPDFSSIEIAIDALTNNVFKEGQLLLIESTLQPGITRKLIMPKILHKKKNLVAGANFFIGYSPERIDPASKQYSSVKSIPKLVSGITENCLSLTELFYSQFIVKVIRTKSPEIAEFAKLYENTFRAVNIAFVNEMARTANRLNMNILDVLAAAYTKPFGIMPFWPTVGTGGHCIPVDLLYMDSWARTNDCYLQFVELSHRINQGMPYYVLQRITQVLNEKLKPLKGSRILLIGITYKPNVADIRTSASLKLAELLAEAGVKLTIYDPFAKNINVKLERALTKELLSSADLTVFSVAHDCLDIDLIYNNSNLILYCAGKPVFPYNKKIYYL
ncbi:MAG: nucleotide sugar dehydrogenase [Candidatus Melainabacteria bacterium]|nr:nucleotide sugar dehydrogenase [Candidatus Melainabacteria bacterium]